MVAGTDSNRKVLRKLRIMFNYFNYTRKFIVKEALAGRADESASGRYQQPQCAMALPPLYGESGELKEYGRESGLTEAMTK